MNYRYVGKSGLRVSPICMGTMSFGSWSDEKESFRILDKAFDHRLPIERLRLPRAHRG